MTMELPIAEALLEEDGYTLVYEEIDDSWRHGAYVWEVYERESDGTFWGASYQRSTDGETNGLRDEEADVVQVEAYDVTVTKYRRVAA